MHNTVIQDHPETLPQEQQQEQQPQPHQEQQQHGQESFTFDGNLVSVQGTEQSDPNCSTNPSMSLFPFFPPAVMGWRDTTPMPMATVDSFQQSYQPTFPSSSSSSQWEKQSPVKQNSIVTSREVRQAGVRKRRSGSRWTEDEDKRLISAYVRNNGRNWTQIAHEVGTGKTGDQCNQHWHRVLNPGISKEPWTIDDDNKLAERVKEMGESSWKKVSDEFPGRTDLQCRHRWLNLKKNASSSRKVKVPKTTRSKSKRKRYESSVVDESTSQEFHHDYGFQQPHGFIAQNESGQLFYATDRMFFGDNFGWQMLQQNPDFQSATMGQGNLSFLHNNQTPMLNSANSSNFEGMQADRSSIQQLNSESATMPMVGSQFPGIDHRFPSTFMPPSNPEDFN